MKNPLAKPGEEKVQKDEKSKEEAPVLKQSKNKGKSPKVSRLHDFSHTHPDHAHHKTFGMDHEPGAF